VDETYVKVAGRWRYVYRAVDQQGQVGDVFGSKSRDTTAATRLLTEAVGVRGEPIEVTTDRAPTLAKAIEEVLPAARHDTEQYANNRVEADHGQQGPPPPDARSAPRPDCQRDHPGHAVIQNLRRGHYELGTYAAPHHELAAAFDQLTRSM
jgi:IS6 family transposase